MTNRPTRLLTSAVGACLLAATGCSDTKFLAAAATLGISDECLGGAPG